MSFSLSRAASAATAAYAVFALAKPRHLATGLEAPADQASSIDLVAYTYGVRDLSISALALVSPDPRLVTGSMLMRIAGDLGDAAILGLSATDPAVRRKVLGVTLGWAAVNTTALLVDRRRDSRRG